MTKIEQVGHPGSARRNEPSGSHVAKCKNAGKHCLRSVLRCGHCSGTCIA